MFAGSGIQLRVKYRRSVALKGVVRGITDQTRGRGYDVGWNKNNRYYTKKGAFGRRKRSSITIGMVAKYIEFGVSPATHNLKAGIVARPFFRNANVRFHNRLVDVIASSARRNHALMAKGSGTPSHILTNRQLGLIAGRHRNAIQAEIRAGTKYPSNTRLTEKIKGFNRPLTETGRMAALVQAKVVS
jgi:hypothetical protein